MIVYAFVVLKHLSHCIVFERECYDFRLQILSNLLIYYNIFIHDPTTTGNSAKSSVLVYQRPNLTKKMSISPSSTVRIVIDHLTWNNPTMKFETRTDRYLTKTYDNTPRVTSVLPTRFKHIEVIFDTIIYN